MQEHAELDGGATVMMGALLQVRDEAEEAPITLIKRLYDKL